MVMKTYKVNPSCVNHLEAKAEMVTLKSRYPCPDCGTKGRIRWSEEHKDVIVECPNRECGYGFIQIYLDYRCNIVGMYPQEET